MSMKNVRGFREQHLSRECGGHPCHAGFCTTHHSFAEAALTGDTLPGICGAEEQHYLESTELQPASFKLWPKLIKRVVKANSGPALGPAFVFVLTAPSHFHCGHGVYDFPVSKVRTVISQYRTALPLFNQGGRLMQRMDRKNYRGQQQKYSRTLSTASLLQSASSAWEGELLSSDENWGSCGSSVWGLLSCTSALCSLGLGTWAPSSLFCFGNLYYLEWDYPKCSLTFNRKTSVKRLPDLTPGHLWTILYCHRNSQLLVCIDVCLCEPRRNDPNSCKAGSPIPRPAESSLLWHWYLWGKQLCHRFSGRSEDLEKLYLSPFQGTDFPCKEVKILLINCNSSM